MDKSYRDTKVTMAPDALDNSLHLMGSLVECQMPDADPPTKAIIKALLFAQSNPGSLVKITCSSSEEVISTCEYLSFKAVSNNWHREKDTVSHDGEGWPILELRNGSGIVIALDKKGKKPHG